MINIIENTKLIEKIFDYDIILVGTNCYGMLGNGFQKDVSVNFPDVNEAAMNIKYADFSMLGTVKVVNRSPIFCLCYITKDFGCTKHLNPVYVDYGAVESCLLTIDNNFKNKRIATTLIGTSEFDGNGDKNKISKIFDNSIKNNILDIYTYEQTKWGKELLIEWHRIKYLIEHKEITYTEWCKLKKNFLWMKKHGMWTPMPL